MAQDFGRLLGSILGGAAGTAIAPGAGTAIGSQIGGQIGGSMGGNKNGGGAGGGVLNSIGSNPSNAGAAFGGISSIIQNIQSLRNQSKAESAMPELIDPNQAAFLAEIGQKRKAMNTGAEFAAGAGLLEEQAGTTANAIVKSSGGDAGGAIEGLLRSQRTTGRGTNELLAKGAQDQKFFTGVYADMLNRISARKMQLQLSRRAQALAEGAQKGQDAYANMANAIARVPSLGGQTTPTDINFDSLLTQQGNEPVEPVMMDENQLVNREITSEMPADGTEIDLNTSSSLLSQF